MCGRFVLISDVSNIVEEFDIDQVSGNVRKSYNIAPGSDAAAVICDGVMKLISLRWGLIPAWAQNPSMGSRLINARAETVADKPSFRDAFKNRRCLIIADGYYEWKRGEKGKIPFYMRLKSQKPFGFAGLYEKWSSPGGQEIQTCSIITTEPNKLVGPIHNRMPAIIPKEGEALWLDSTVFDRRALLDLLGPLPGEAMETYPVSTLVNVPAHNFSECIAPLSQGDSEKTWAGNGVLKSEKL